MSSSVKTDHWTEPHKIYYNQQTGSVTTAHEKTSVSPEIGGLPAIRGMPV